MTLKVPVAFYLPSGSFIYLFTISIILLNFFGVRIRTRYRNTGCQTVTLRSFRNKKHAIFKLIP
jgi:hypothetical protein